MSGHGDKETGHGMSWTRKVEKRRNCKGEAIVQGGKRAASGRGLGLAAKREHTLENNIIRLFFVIYFKEKCSAFCVSPAGTLCPTLL